MFWSVISDSFIKQIYECFEKRKMSFSQRQAIITLIEKKKRKRSFTSRKLASNLPGKRTQIHIKCLKQFPQDLISFTIQPGYVIKDRSIGKTVCSIFDITDFTIKENIPDSLISINYKKAFDCVECGLQLPKGV